MLVFPRTALCPPGCRQMLTNSYLASSAPPCFLPSSQPDGDRRQGADKGVSSSLGFPAAVGREERKEERRRDHGREKGNGRRRQTWNVTSIVSHPVGERLWSVGGFPLPCLSRMSYYINHAPRLKMTGNFSTPSKIACVLSGFSHVRLFATLWTVARLVPLSLGLSRQE